MRNISRICLRLFQLFWLAVQMFQIPSTYRMIFYKCPESIHISGTNKPNKLKFYVVIYYRLGMTLYQNFIKILNLSKKNQKLWTYKIKINSIISKKFFLSDIIGFRQ